jgi:hypothetical protein
MERGNWETDRTLERRRAGLLEKRLKLPDNVIGNVPVPPAKILIAPDYT